MYPSLMTFSGDLFAEFDAIQRQLERLFGLGEMPSSIRAATRGAFPLGRDLDKERIDARLVNGVLTLDIPKLEQARPRRISVKAQ